MIVSVEFWSSLTSTSSSRTIAARASARAKTRSPAQSRCVAEAGIQRSGIGAPHFHLPLHETICPTGSSRPQGLVATPTAELSLERSVDSPFDCVSRHAPLLKLPDRGQVGPTPIIRNAMVPRGQAQIRRGNRRERIVTTAPRLPAWFSLCGQHARKLSQTVTGPSS